MSDEQPYARITTIVEDEDGIKAYVSEKVSEVTVRSTPKYGNSFPYLHSSDYYASVEEHHITIEFDAHPAEPRSEIYRFYDTKTLHDSDERIKKAYDSYVAFVEYEGAPIGRVVLMQPLIDSVEALGPAQKVIYQAVIKLYEQNKTFKNV